MDIQQSIDGELRELALFAGAGGGILGGQLLGWRTVCAVEIEPYPASVLLARQNDGLLPPFPVWDDIRTFDGRPWAGIVDVVSGGFPCQDISAAGKGAGLDGERSGLWVEMARIIGEVRPAFVYVENSPMLTARGLGRVLGDLASMGFDAVWGVLGASDAIWINCTPAVDHERFRIWIIAKDANAGSGRLSESKKWKSEQPRRTEVISSSSTRTNTIKQGWEEWSFLSRRKRKKESTISRETFDRSGWWSVEPDVGRVAHGVVARVDRLKALGNGQVPQCAAEAWRILIKQLEDKRHE